MKTKKIEFKNFENEKLSRREQQTIGGGDDPGDTIRGNGKGSTDVEGHP
ncbi:rSAM-modified peptide [Flavobacterium sp. N502536]|nr:rSAM-modified peptide [Flavobacterium sp. N502536]